MSDIPSLKGATEAVQLARPKMPKIPEAGSKSDMETIAREFETMFLDVVHKAMRQTIQESDLFEKSSQQNEVFQQMLDSEYSSMAAHRGKGGNGIAEMLMKQFNRNLPQNRGVKNEN